MADGINTITAAEHAAICDSESAYPFDPDIYFCIRCQNYIDVSAERILASRKKIKPSAEEI